MFREDLAMEHYRVHVMEQWPEGPSRKAGLAAAFSRIEGLTRATESGSGFVCLTCGGSPTGDEKPTDHVSLNF